MDIIGTKNLRDVIELKVADVVSDDLVPVSGHSPKRSVSPPHQLRDLNRCLAAQLPLVEKIDKVEPPLIGADNGPASGICKGQQWSNRQVAYCISWGYVQCRQSVRLSVPG